MERKSWNSNSLTFALLRIFCHWRVKLFTTLSLAPDSGGFSLEKWLGKGYRLEQSRKRLPDTRGLNVDSRDGPGYTYTRWYVLVLPHGTFLPRRLQIADVRLSLTAHHIRKGEGYV